MSASRRWLSFLPTPVVRFLIYVLGFRKLVIFLEFLLIASPTLLIVGIGWKLTGSLRGAILFLALAAMCFAGIAALYSLLKSVRLRR